MEEGAQWHAKDPAKILTQKKERKTDYMLTISRYHKAKKHS